MLAATKATEMAAWLNEAGLGPLVGLLMTLGAVETGLSWFERVARMAEPL